MGSYTVGSPLIYMHAPKTAGTAVITAIYEVMRPASFFSGFDASLFGSFRDFKGLGESEQTSIYLDASKVPSNSDFVAAHMSYSTLKKLFPSGVFVTTIREPICRLVSLWLYWRGMSNAQLSGWGDDWGSRVRLSRLPLIDFISAKSIACQTDNLLTRMLLWPHDLIAEDGFIEEKHDVQIFKEILQRLEQFDFVDFVENPEFALNLTRWLGKPVNIARINETGRMPEPLRSSQASQFSSMAEHLLNMRTRLDLKIWFVLAERSLAHSRAEKLRKKIMIENASRHSMLLR